MKQRRKFLISLLLLCLALLASLLVACGSASAPEPESTLEPSAEPENTPEPAPETPAEPVPEAPAEPAATE